MKVFALLLLCVLHTRAAIIYQLNESEYALMPPMVSLDPYHSCLQDSDAQYCSGYMTFVADHPSPLLTMMQDYSADTLRHFNHSRSFAGTCLTQTCKRFIKQDTTQDPIQILEACLNHTYSELYNLKVRVDNNVICREMNSPIFEIDTIDIVVAAFLVALILLNVIGSFIDIYEYHPNVPGASAFLCFSIPRNWKKLVGPPSSEPRVEILKGLFTVRTILMTFIIMGHAVIPIIMVCENPKFVEDAYTNSLYHIVLNGPLLMQCFFFMSAMLQAYFMQIHAETNHIDWKIVPKGMFLRWMRLTPAYGVVLVVIMTWFKHFGTGPIFDEAVTKESIDCTQDWWLHLLYINNYKDTSKCMLPSWFLAADTQLFCLGMIIFIMCHKSRFRNIVLSSLLVVGMIIPALHTYFQDLNGVFVPSPMTIMEFFANDNTFHNIYKRGHTNLPAYILGMATGYLVYSWKKNKVDLSKYWMLRIVYWLLIPAMCIIMASCKPFYETPRMHILYRGLAAAFINPVLGVICVLYALFIVFKVDSIWERIYSWRGFIVLGRLCYSAFLLHEPIVRHVGGTMWHRVRVSSGLMTSMGVYLVVITFLLAFIFWLTVEAPFGQLVKIYQMPAKCNIQLNNKKKNK